MQLFTHLFLFLFAVRHWHSPGSPARTKKLPSNDTSNQPVCTLHILVHMACAVCPFFGVLYCTAMTEPFQSHHAIPFLPPPGEMSKEGPHSKHSPRDEGRRNICFITLLMHWPTVLNKPATASMCAQGSIMIWCIGGLCHTKCQRISIVLVVAVSSLIAVYQPNNVWMRIMHACHALVPMIDIIAWTFNHDKKKR
jgi:hypothetical protein